MNPLGWLFRAVSRAFGRPGVQQGTQIAQTRITNQQERQQQIANIPQGVLAYAGWRNANSSWILDINYNPLVPFAQMRVKRTMKVYTFGGMTFTTYAAWVQADSKGSFFNRYLKGRYTRWASNPNVTPPDVFSFASGAGSVPVTKR